ncbi:MAG: hypothetical protein ACREE6_12720 [Limisphaerales bacterium]
MGSSKPKALEARMILAQGRGLRERGPGLATPKPQPLFAGSRHCANLTRGAVVALVPSRLTI